MKSSRASAAAHEPKKKEKREAEADGRDLLVAYLSDVGGYDRNYRDVEDEDESGSSGSLVTNYCLRDPFLLHKKKHDVLLTL